MKKNNKFSIPKFSETGFSSIKDFFISQYSITHTVEDKPTELIGEINSAPRSAENISTSNQELLCCKKCNTKTSLEANYGRYGYYLKCNECQANTALKRICKYPK